MSFLLSKQGGGSTINAWRQTLDILSLKFDFLTPVSRLSEYSVLKRAERKTSESGQLTTSMTQAELALKMNYFQIGIIT